MTDTKREDEDVLKAYLARQASDVVLVGPSESSGALREAVLAASRRGQPLVVIRTSGSNDYLNDNTAGQRFWPVAIPHEGDLVDPHDDEYDDDRRDEHEEME